MILRYTGLTQGWLWEDMLVEVPTNWRTTEFGNVTADARSEIMDALWSKGITFGNSRILRHIYHTTHLSDGLFFTHWVKA